MFKAHIFPSRLENFACASEQKKADDSRLRPAGSFKLPHEPSRLIGRKVALPLNVNLEGSHASAWRSTGRQKAMQRRKRANALEHGQNPIACRWSQSLNRKSLQAGFNFVAIDAGELAVTKGR